MNENHRGVGHLFQFDDDAFGIIASEGLKLGTIQSQDVIGDSSDGFGLEITIVDGKVVINYGE